MRLEHIEQKINFVLNKMPFLKVGIKRCYQVVMYTLSDKKSHEGNIVRISPDDPNHEYFFGYYDKSPWDASGRYMICMKADNTWSVPDPMGEAEILLIDTKNNNNKLIATTHTWNVQQGCMAQWLGPDFATHILYNDLRDGKYCSVVLNITTNKERVLPIPVYSVSEDGKTALTLDFSRLHNLRLGYGYAAIEEKTKGIALPDETCIWKTDIESGRVIPLLKYTDFASFQPRPEMLEKEAIHKVNHIMISPSGKRFMVLYRWFCGQRKYTRLITCDIDGSNMYVLSDDDMVSHCFWRDDEHILAFENKHGSGPGYYLMKDKTQEYTHFWPNITNDGHPSYSPDKKHIVTDSYPDRSRMASIKILEESQENASDHSMIARVFAPFRYDNDTRCDLHPRWKRDGSQICFDSVFEGHRGLYIIDMPHE